MAKTALALLVILSAIPMMAFASDNPYSTGYDAGYRLGSYIGKSQAMLVRTWVYSRVQQPFFSFALANAGLLALAARMPNSSFNPNPLRGSA